MTTNADIEFKAMQDTFAALEPLDREAQLRALKYIINRLDLDIDLTPPPPPSPAEVVDLESKQVDEIKEKERAATKFGTFAELFDAAQPDSNADKALVAGYWLQVCLGADSFDGQSVNKELKNLGHGLGNVTNAVESLKGQRPALALQLRKSGTSQQARKTYKVTVAGMKAVEAMISE